MSLLTLDLPSGVRLSIHSLWQESTYAGLLEGYPNARMNQGHLDEIAQTAAKLFPGQPFFLARPYITRVAGDYKPWGPREDLPAVTCVGLARALDGIDELTMALGWFQDRPAPPIPPEVLEELLRVDWSRALRSEL